MALGAYEMTPVEVAGAYTAFATVGTRAEPFYLKNVASAGGNYPGKVHADEQAGARSPRGLSGGQHFAGRDEQRHRRSSSRKGIHLAGGGENRYLA